MVLDYDSLDFYRLSWAICTARNALVVFILTFTLRCWLGYRKAVAEVDNLPGYRMLSLLVGFIHPFFSYIPGLTVHSNFAHYDGHIPFEQTGWDAISQVSAWPRPSAHILVADAEAIKTICSSRTKFTKPVERYKVVGCFGDNIITSEGDTWKRHRKVAQPAFSEKNNKLVWDEAIRVTEEMFESWGEGDKSIKHAVDDITFPLALLVVSSAGFGRRISWLGMDEIEAGHTISFCEALARLSSDLWLRVLIPRWAMPFKERWRRFQHAYDEFSVYMHRMIKQRREGTANAESDLFSSILSSASDTDVDPDGLSESEVIGNSFVFLLAGHETTAHTLAFSLAFLALYPDEQEKLYQQIRSVVGDAAGPTYEQFGRLTYALAVFYETLRLCSPVAGIPKICAEDTVFNIQPALKEGQPAPATGVKEEKLTITVRKGSQVRISMTGLHYNPRYWPEPYEFRPSRFLAPDWPRDALLPFSGGSRSCLGKRFFETEGVAFMCALVKRYKIELPPGQTKESMLQSRLGLTLTPLNVPLELKRRA